MKPGSGKLTEEQCKQIRKEANYKSFGPNNAYINVLCNIPSIAQVTYKVLEIKPDVHVILMESLDILNPENIIRFMSCLFQGFIDRNKTNRIETTVFFLDSFSQNTWFTPFKIMMKGNDRIINIEIFIVLLNSYLNGKNTVDTGLEFVVENKMMHFNILASTDIYKEIKEFFMNGTEEKEIPINKSWYSTASWTFKIQKKSVDNYLVNLKPCDDVSDQYSRDVLNELTMLLLVFLYHNYQNHQYTIDLGKEFTWFFRCMETNLKTSITKDDVNKFYTYLINNPGLWKDNQFSKS